MDFLSNNTACLVSIFSLVVSMILIILVAFNEEQFRHRRGVVAMSGSATGRLANSQPAEDTPWWQWVLYALGAILFFMVVYGCLTSGNCIMIY